MHERGFSLLEVLISAAMLMIGLTAVLQYQSSALAVVGKEQHVLTATHVAELTMERLLLMHPNDTMLTAGPHTGSRFDDYAKVSSSGNFQASWTVTVDDPIPTARRLIVTVTWTERGKLRDLVLESVRS